jgi:hypothetical protein
MRYINGLTENLMGEGPFTPLGNMSRDAALPKSSSGKNRFMSKALLRPNV